MRGIRAHMAFGVILMPTIIAPIALHRLSAWWWPAPPAAVGLIVIVATVALSIVAVTVIVRSRRLKGSQPQYFLFAGLLLLCPLGLTIASPTSILPFSRHPTSDRVIFLDVSHSVYFPNEDGRRFHGAVFQENALALAEKLLCEHLTRADQPPALVPKPGFLRWCCEYWPLLVNWQSVPVPILEGDVKCRFYFLEGDRCWPARNDDRDTVLQSLTDEGSFPQPKSPRSVAEVLGQFEQDTHVVMIATGEVDTPEQCAAWKEVRAPEGVRVVIYLLPSVARSGQVKLRGASAKAELLRPLSETLVSLGDVGCSLGTDAELQWFEFAVLDRSLFGGNDPATANRPRDLDVDRRRVLGPKQAEVILQREKEGVLARSLPGVASSVQLTTQVDLLTIVCEVAVTVVLLLLIAVSVPIRTVSLKLNVRPPTWWALLGASALGVLGAFVLIVAIWLFWPDVRWRSCNPPAAAVWGYLTFWTMLVAWPVLREWIWCSWPQPTDHNPSHPGTVLRAVVVVTFALMAVSPAQGLLSESRSLALQTAAMLVPPLVVVVAGFVVAFRGRNRFATSGGPNVDQSSFPQAPEDPHVTERSVDAWADFHYWSPVATAFALWMGFLLAGTTATSGTSTELWQSYSDARMLCITVCSSILLLGLALPCLTTYLFVRDEERFRVIH